MGANQINIQQLSNFAVANEGDLGIGTSVRSARVGVWWLADKSKCWCMYGYNGRRRRARIGVFRDRLSWVLSALCTTDWDQASFDTCVKM